MSMHWVREACRDYTEVSDGAIIAPGRLGKALKPLVEANTWYVVRPAWRHFVKVTELRFATPELFARTYPDWIIAPKAPTSIPRQQRVIDPGPGQRLQMVWDDGPEAA